MITSRTHEYRRRLPHYQKAGRALFVTFRKLSKEPLPNETPEGCSPALPRRSRQQVSPHAAVVMPEHVHLLLTPLTDAQGWPYELRTILKLIKGASARSVNRLLRQSGPLWKDESFDHVLRSNESFEEKLEYIRQNPVRRGLVQTREQYPWLWVEPCGAGIPTRE